MPFTLDRYAQVRPYLYHLTKRDNIARLQHTRYLESAEHLATLTPSAHPITAQRKTDHPLHIGDYTIALRDQAPLHRGNIAFTDGWDYARLLQELNRRVYFWPGTATGPISYGVRHYERYQPDGPAVLRISLADLLQNNPDTAPFFCRYNSGSPRYSNGKASPRGANTFVAAEQATFRPSEVVEVTFLQRIKLPDTAELADSYNGPWSTLFTF